MKNGLCFIRRGGNSSGDDYRIVAEGVETEAEMRLLSSWNVDMIQG